LIDTHKNGRELASGSKVKLIIKDIQIVEGGTLILGCELH